MLEQHYSETISDADFAAILQSYPDQVPQKLDELEQQRLVSIPKALSERKPAHLTKLEVQTLVDWKLAHGTFRPSLRKLVESNSAEVVEETTKTAYELYDKDHGAWELSVKKLAELRGIGPATASLLLSVYDCENVPFFSDELFRWTKLGEAKGQGWDRKIKYSMGEYKEMFALVQDLRERIGHPDKQKGERVPVTALEAEKVAYVLGRMGDGEKIKGGTKRAAAKDETINQQEASLNSAKALSPSPPTTGKRRKLRSSA